MKTALRLIAVATLVLAALVAANALAQESMSPATNTPAPQPKPRESRFKLLVVQPGESTGDVTCVFCSLVVYGTVDGEAVAVWGNVDVHGTVTGEATAVGGSVALRSGSHVTGDATAVGGRVVRESGATLEGDANSVWYIYFPGQRGVFTPGLFIYFAIHISLVFLVFVTLRARRVQAIGAALKHRPVLTVLAGLFVNGAIIAVLSALNLRGWGDTAVSIGLPLFLVAITLPGIVGISYLLGHALRGSASPVTAALLGAILLVALSAIPLAGLAVYTVFGVLAAGATLVSRFGFAPQTSDGR